MLCTLLNQQPQLSKSPTKTLSIPLNPLILCPGHRQGPALGLEGRPHTPLQAMVRRSMAHGEGCCFEGILGGVCLSVPFEKPKQTQLAKALHDPFCMDTLRRPAFLLFLLFLLLGSRVASFDHRDPSAEGFGELGRLGAWPGRNGAAMSPFPRLLPLLFFMNTWFKL